MSGLCPYSPLDPEYPLPTALSFSDIPPHALSTWVDWPRDILASGSCSSAHSLAEGQNRVKLVHLDPRASGIAESAVVPCAWLGARCSCQKWGFDPNHLCNKLRDLEIGDMNSWKHG